jgi:hypothetical protein
MRLLGLAPRKPLSDFIQAGAVGSLPFAVEGAQHAVTACPERGGEGAGEHTWLAARDSAMPSAEITPYKPTYQDLNLRHLG